MPKDATPEFEGMPERQPERTVTFLGAKTHAEREFQAREQVKFVITGYVREQGMRYLEDEDNPVEPFVKVQVTSIHEA